MVTRKGTKMKIKAVRLRVRSCKPGLPDARSTETRPIEPLSPLPEPLATPPEEPVSLLMAGMSLAGAGAAALLMIPITATVTLTALPFLVGSGWMRRNW